MAEEVDIVALEQALAPLSHGTEALNILRSTLKQIGKPSVREDFLNNHLLRAPIFHADVSPLICPSPEMFHMLQGDIIRTEAAHVLGIRRIDNPSYVVATSTCDMIPGRRKGALLLPIHPRKAQSLSRELLNDEVANLVSFKSNQYFYLPPLEDDEPDVLYNRAHLDPLAHCANEDVCIAERRASMTLIGWRIFGAFLRNMQVREAPEEIAIRRC